MTDDERTASSPRRPESVDHLATARAKRFGLVAGARGDRYLLWFGGLMAAALVAVAFATVGNPRAPHPENGPLAITANQLAAFPPELADRANCAEIGVSDLRSSPEGLWFQTNCGPALEAGRTVVSTNCNRTWLDPAEFTAVARGLYVTRLTWAAPSYLWYASSETCFDLVSAEIVTAVCADQTVTFSWSKSACAAHGGVLMLVNAR